MPREPTRTNEVVYIAWRWTSPSRDAGVSTSGGSTSLPGRLCHCQLGCPSKGDNEDWQPATTAKSPIQRLSWKDLPWRDELDEQLGQKTAIIHDKIVVIDPLSDNAVVAFGSHNLGYKAAYGNDENLMIV